MDGLYRTVWNSSTDSGMRYIERYIEKARKQREKERDVMGQERREIEDDLKQIIRKRQIKTTVVKFGEVWRVLHEGSEGRAVVMTPHPPPETPKYRTLAYSMRIARDGSAGQNQLIALLGVSLAEYAALKRQVVKYRVFQTPMAF